MASIGYDRVRAEAGTGGRFPKSHRLYRRVLIRALFDRDESTTRLLSCGSLRILYRFVPQVASESQASVQVGFAVGKAIGGAVRRNRIRRILRETWRLNRGVFPKRHRSADAMLTCMVLVRRRIEDDGILRSDMLGCMRLLGEAMRTHPDWKAS